MKNKIRVVLILICAMLIFNILSSDFIISTYGIFKPEWIGWNETIEFNDYGILNPCKVRNLKVEVVSAYISYEFKNCTKEYKEMVNSAMRNDQNEIDFNIRHINRKYTDSTTAILVSNYKRSSLFTPDYPDVGFFLIIYSEYSKKIHGFVF